MMKKGKPIPKINTFAYGGRWIAAGLIIGIVLPLILRLVLGRILWPLVIAGGIILAAFGVLFALEMHQDFGAVPHYQKTLRDTIPFDPETQYAVIRGSICTGERVAGFKNKADGHFTEVMVLRDARDEQRFREIYGLDTVRTEY
jgi:hypothetical protein